MRGQARDWRIDSRRPQPLPIVALGSEMRIPFDVHKVRYMFCARRDHLVTVFVRIQWKIMFTLYSVYLLRIVVPVVPSLTEHSIHDPALGQLVVLDPKPS